VLGVPTLIAKCARFVPLLRSARLSGDQLRGLQERRLRSLVRHAWSEVPFYRELWGRHGVSAPDDVRTVDDLARLPVVTKDELRAAGPAALARDVEPSSCVRMWTSGTEGRPFTVPITPAEAQTRLLVEFRTLLAMGLRPRDRLVVVGPVTPRPPTLAERLGVFRTEVIPGNLALDELMRRLVAARPTVLWSYPGPLHAVMHEVGYHLGRLVQPRILITSGGAILPTIARCIRDELACDLFNSYGCMEAGRIAAECPHHRGLHVQADQLILEAGEGHGNVLTVLNQRTMPLIRYRLGDLCTLAEGPCPCGSAFPRIERIEGRADDMLLLPSGRLVSPWTPQSVLAERDGIRQFRFVQDSPDRLELILVVDHGWTAERQAQALQELRAALEEQVEVEVAVVDEMPPDDGKFRSVVSRVAGRM
jgi:phenylacetate-CoA ligase